MPALLRHPARRRCALVAVAFLLCVAPRFAHAQADAPAPAAATPGEDDPVVVAKRHFLNAVALYNDGSFDAALAEFLASQRLRPASALLYNIGLTYKALFLYNDSIRTLEQYLKEEQSMPHERRVEVEQILREMRAILAPVNMVIAPDGANVQVDGRSIGTAPIGQYLVPAGRHVVTVTADGYSTQTKELMVSAGSPGQLTISLAIIPKTGRVRISAAPDAAWVRIDGKSFPPPVDLELPLGGHTLEVMATGYVTHREELVVAAGQTREVSVLLRRPPLGRRTVFLVPVVLGSILLATGISLGIACGGYHKCEAEAPLKGTLTPGDGSVGK
jgi:hypothetical protein